MGDGEPEPRTPTISATGNRCLRFSKGGRRVDGDSQVFLVERQGRHQTIQLSLDGGDDPVWSADGKTLYYIRERHEVWQVDLATEREIARPEPRMLLASVQPIGQLEITPDGERFLAEYTFRDTPPVSIIARSRR